MKNITFLVAIMATFAFSGNLLSQNNLIKSKNIVDRFVDSTGKVVLGIRVPGKPPDIFRMPQAPISPTAVTIQNVPAYDWSFGCSSTSAAMQAGYYDRTGYYNIYAGPTQGGLMPMDNSLWGSVTINGELRKQCPLSATRNGVDGRSSRGHVDDYWVHYQSTASDPYITNGWTQHTWGECTGDYMGTSQSALGNIDGETVFYSYEDGTPCCNYAAPAGHKDGCRGLREFYESRGYTVLSNCTQLIYGYNGNTAGFTFTQYKQEIDAGRPVLIQVEDHTMLGFGYDNTGNLVYLHDTWDYSSHTMTWGGSYNQLPQWGVTTMLLQSMTPNPCSNIISLGTGGSQNSKTYWGGGIGEWFNTTLNPCNYYTPGIEQVYSFTPLVTGQYSIMVTTADGSFVSYMWKASSCSSSGWSCIANINTPGTYGSLALTAGTTYYILLDDINSTEGEHTFFISQNPCDNITVVGGTGPGYLQTYPGGGIGVWYTTSSTPCGSACPGQEKIFSFSPSISGLYSLVVTATSGNAYYMWQSDCSVAGWNCCSYVPSPGTYGSMLMVAGTTYYILADDNNTTASNQTFYLTLTEPAGNWEGNIDHNWNNPYNWSATYVPSTDVDVTIYSGYTFSPVIIAGAADCNNITIGTDAVLLIGAAGLTVGGDLDIFGQLAMNNDAGVLTVNNDIYWESTSLANITASAVMWIYGDWEFRIGANVQIASGNVDFTGSSTAYIRVYSPGCSFNNVGVYKSPGCELGFSHLSTNDLVINGYFSIQSNATFGAYSAQATILRGGFFNNSHFHFNSGTLVLDGTAQSIKPNVGDYVNNLIFSATVGVSFNNVYTNTFVVNGDLTIESGVFNPQNNTVEAGGNWTNAVGPAGFVEGTGTVIFNGGNFHQYCSNEVFNILEVDKPLGGALRMDGTNVVCGSYTWTAGAIDVLSGSFTANELDYFGIYGNYYLHPGGVINLYNTEGLVDLNGFLNISGGIFNVYGGDIPGAGAESLWAFHADAGIAMSSGILDFKDVGVKIFSSPLGYEFTENITGGIIRTSRGFIIDLTFFTPEGGTIEFYGPDNGNMHTMFGGYFKNVIINKSVPAGSANSKGIIVRTEGDSLFSGDAPLANTITIDGTTDINGNLTILAGVLASENTTINVAGNWNNLVGAAGFSEGQCTVIFDGANDADILSSETFYRVELNKTYNAFDGLELTQNVTCLGDLHIYDGCLEMNDPADLTVSGDIWIDVDAGLNANDGYGPEIYIGENWINSNASYTTNFGFDPGISSTVIFNGTSDQLAGSNAPQLEFSTLKIDKSSGQFRPNDGVFTNRDVIINSGEWNDADAGLTHQVERNFTVNSAGGFLNSFAQNTVEFVGNRNSILTYASAQGYFHNVFINKGTAYKVTQASNASLLFNGDFTVETGLYNIGGYQMIVTGDINVNASGKLTIPQGSTLILTDLNNLNVNNGGTLEVNGISGNMATITANTSTARYNLNINSGGNIAADFGNFRRISPYGLYVKQGAAVDQAHAFTGCNFFEGSAGGTLLTLDNSQTLTIRNTLFPTNTWGGASNVKKSMNMGLVYFVDYSGSFSGEDYDDDPYSRLLWVTTLLANATATPEIICSGSSSQLKANASGGTTPYTYLWSPAGSLSDPSVSNPVASPVATTAYSLLLTDALGTTVADVVTVTVSTALPVSVTISASGNPVIPGTMVNFTATPVNGGTTPSYQWKVNGVNVGTGLSTYAYIPNQNDEVWCIMISNGPCVSGNPATSNVITMTLVNLNTNVSGVVAPPISVCYDAFNTIVVAGGGTSFLVQSGGSAIMIAGSGIFYRNGTKVEPGGYMHGYITTTNSYCENLPLSMATEVTGVENMTAATLPGVISDHRFTLFPNPTNGKFTLLVNDDNPVGMISVKISGMRGERVLTEEMILFRRIELDMSGVPSGIYFVQILANDRQEVVKLVVTQ